MACYIISDASRKRLSNAGVLLSASDKRTPPGGWDALLSQISEAARCLLGVADALIVVLFDDGRATYTSVDWT